MAKDQKIEELNEKIDSLHSTFSTRLMEKEKEIYSKIIDYFSRLGHDMNPFKQEVLDEPAKPSSAKKKITKKPSGITPASSPAFTDYFHDASLPNNSILLNTPDKMSQREHESTFKPVKTAAVKTPVKKVTPKKAPIKATTPKKAVTKKPITKIVKKAAVKAGAKKVAPKKAPIKTATIKKAVTKKPAIKKIAPKKAPVKAASASAAKKHVTKK